MRKAVAVTQRSMENPSYHEVRDALDVNWGGFMEGAGLVPVLLPTNYAAFSDFFSITEIRGLLLTGGNGLGRLDGSPLSLRRDIFEKDLLHFALNRNLPVLGVCRGAQVIADFFGSEFRRVTEAHVRTRHKLVTEGCSKYGGLLAPVKDANSFHDYAISTLPPEIRAVVRSEDGVIEAIEHIRMPVLGIMWHPEREAPFRDEDLSLFRRFFI